MFDTVLLRSFVAVVQEGGFTLAAARLNLTQSAVSAHLRRLEKQTGRDLLARTTRSVTLTADGELLLGYARAILHSTMMRRRSFRAHRARARSVSAFPKTSPTSG